MLALSGPIIIGKIEVDQHQIVIRKDEDPLSHTPSFTCISSMRKSLRPTRSLRFLGVLSYH